MSTTPRGNDIFEVNGLLLREGASEATVVDAALAYDRQSPQIPTLLLSRFIDQNMLEVERSSPRSRSKCQGSLS